MRSIFDLRATVRILIPLVISAVSPMLAQTTLSLGSVGGAIRDESGAVVAGAKVILTEESKGLVRETESGSDGRFLFPATIAGSYSARVEKPGFNLVTMTGLRIEVGEQASVEITLHVGEVRTTLTVTAPTATELDAESNTISSSVDSSQVRELPLNGRDFLQLAKLSAGTLDVSSASNLFSGNIGPPDRVIVLPGTLPNSVNYFLNGVDITGSRDGELALSPSPAGVDQFTVQHSFLMPDQGVYPAVVNIVTKSGTNQFHGEAFEFLRNGNLDARSFFSPGPEDLKRNQFGAAAGGPLWKDRAWFHVFYEGLREISAFSSAGYSPTQQMFEGNFAGTGHVIYNPLTWDPASGTRQPFPNNAIPSSQINQVAKNLLNYYLPGSSLASTPSNVYGNPRNMQDDDQGGLRLDAAVSARQQLSGQFFRQNSPTDEPGLYPLSGLLYSNGGTLVEVQHVWSLSNQAVNSLRFSFLSNTAIGGNEGQGLGPIIKSIGIANTFETNGVTAINLQGYSQFGRANGQVGNRDNAWQLSEGFTYTRARHNFSFGAGILYRRGWHLNSNAQALGTLYFQPTFTAQLAPNAQGQPVPMANTGDSFADFLLGIPVNGTMLGAPVIQYRSTQFAPNFQDTWKITSTLALNYGISWYLETPPEPQGQAKQAVHGFDTATGLLTYAALGQISSQPFAMDRNNFAPRVGLAWQPRLLKSAVIRAAAGVYYSPFRWLLAFFPVGPGSPMSAGVTLTNNQTNPAPTYTLGVNLFPSPPAAALTSAYATNLPPGTTATALNPNFRTSYINQWNFSIQHSLSRSDSVEFDYLGSSAHKLANLLDLSQCQPAPNLFCSPATRPWPRYSLLYYADSRGNSSYEAGVAKYEHRSAFGFDLRFEYAFAKALTDSYQSSLLIFNQISSCRSCSKGPATFDVRNRAVGSFMWDLPVGRGRRFAGRLPGWVDIALGGWTLSAITTFATGQPVMLMAPNQTGSAIITSLPNRVCDGRSDRLSSNIRNNGFLWFDASCFVVPDVGYFGNSGATVINGPGLNNWDVGVLKVFPLVRDSIKLQLRGEFFNAWNHAQFGQPNGNAGAGPNFGRISSTGPPRLIQVAAKVYW